MAISEFRQRHYDKVILTKEEFDLNTEEIADNILEAIRLLKELKEAVTKSEEKDKPDAVSREEKMLELLKDV